jgi:hypothetical protein
MKSDKYMGMDVHQAMTLVAVLNADGKVILETMVPTGAAAIIRLVQSLSAPLRVTFEETTQAEWLRHFRDRILPERLRLDCEFRGAYLPINAEA